MVRRASQHESIEMAARVLYDHQIFSLQSYGGISRYYGELFRRYASDPDLDIDLALAFSGNQYLEGTRFSSRYWASDTLRSRTVAKARDLTGIDLKYWTNQRVSARALRRQDFDIFHPTYYDPYFIEPLGRKPCYLIVHDMIHDLLTQYYPANAKVIGWKKAVVDRADHIVTVSANTKNDLCRLYGVDGSRVRVIRQGISLDPPPGPVERPDGVPERYILFVGHRWTYKNFDRFLEAVSPLLAKDRELHLLCVGGDPFSEAEDLRISRLGLAGQVRQMRVDDSFLIALYKNALAFVFPSLYEGFGLPVLEAFACGCPAVLSNTSSLPELGGDAAEYFDPGDEASMAEGISRVVQDEGLRARMTAQGLERAKLFSWDRTARETKAAYLSML
jgi:glycosyltransferase involved in cell wall biosynthesis